MDKTKIENLRKLLATVVKNSKNGVTSASEANQISKVLSDTLGRKPTDAEIKAVTPL